MTLATRPFNTRIGLVGESLPKTFATLRIRCAVGGGFAVTQQETLMFIANTNRQAVAAEYADAAKIVKVEGGYMVFMTMTEYQTWQNQK